MLKLKDIYYHPSTSENPILKGISLDIKRGQPLIISGASGTGKTSLIEVISGLASQNKGTILYEEQQVTERQRRAICGVVFQFPERHFIGMTVAHELRLGHRRLPGELQSEVLTKVGLDLIDITDFPERLSGGQQRRLAIAVQLIRKPKILLLDEPTAGLDWSIRDEILNLIKKLSKEQYMVIVTHEPEIFSSWNISNFQLQSNSLNTSFN